MRGPRAPNAPFGQKMDFGIFECDPESEQGGIGINSFKQISGRSGYFYDQFSFYPSGFIIERFLYKPTFIPVKNESVYTALYIEKRYLRYYNQIYGLDHWGHITRHSGSQLQAFIAGRNTRLGIIDDAFV